MMHSASTTVSQKPSMILGRYCAMTRALKKLSVKRSHPVMARACAARLRYDGPGGRTVPRHR